MACELHDHIIQAFVLEKSPLPLADFVVGLLVKTECDHGKMY